MAWRDTPVPGRATLPAGAPVLPEAAPVAPLLLTPSRPSPTLASPVGGGSRVAAVAWALAGLGVIAVGVWLLGGAGAAVPAAARPPVAAATSAPYGPYPLARKATTRIHLRPEFGSGHRRATIDPGESVTVRCRVTGPTVTGPYGPTSDWDLVVDPVPGYVPDAYIDTSAFDDIPRCPTR